MDKVKTIAANGAFIALIAIVLIWGTTLHRQQVQFNKGEDGMAAGDFLAAVSGYESAIHMYTPLSSLVDRAAQKLWDLGELALQRGDRARALIAYRSLRSSFYAVSGIYAPGQQWIQKCDARIAELLMSHQVR